MRFYIRLIFSLSLLFWAQFAFAVDYGWQFTGVPTIYSSPSQGCKAQFGESTRATFYTQKSFYCESYFAAGGNWYLRDTIWRSGDSCPDNGVYKPETGGCEAPEPNECEAKNGQSLPFTKNGLGTDSYCTFIPGISACSQSACFSGCAVDTFDQKCTFNTSGKYTCVGSAIFTGQECSTSGQGTEIESDAYNTPRPEPKTQGGCRS